MQNKRRKLQSENYRRAGQDNTTAVPAFRVRFDCGIRITQYLLEDSLIALIVHASTREEAIRKCAALAS